MTTPRKQLANQSKMKPWFLLYGGQSCDGSGLGEYEGRTLDPKVAYEHFKKVGANPYSTGCVRVVTDDKVHRPIWEHEMKQYLEMEDLRKEKGYE